MTLTLTGRRTLLCCLVIVTLALCQRFLGLRVPQEVWIGLFAAALAFLRLGLPPGSAACGCLLPLGATLLAGCITVTNNVGDSAVEAASGGSAALSASNSVYAATSGTNRTETAGAANLRGGIVIQTTVNKPVAPATSTALQYIP